MRIARPCLLVAYLTAFAGYFFNCLVVYRSVFFLLCSTVEINVLIAFVLLWAPCTTPMA